MTKGFALMIRRQAGEQIERKLQEKAPLAIGAAYVTPASGTLKCKYVIHSPVVLEVGGRVSTENIRRAARAALLTCDVNKYQSLALPPIGMDIGEIAPEEATRAIVEELRAHKRPFPTQVVLATTDIYVAQTFEESLRMAASSNS